MSTASTTETLQQALQALYHHPDAEVRTAANIWLEQFQNTQEAWQISDSLLHNSNSSVEVQYFCAQTLRTKAQRDFEELPPGVGATLRDSLLTLIRKFSGGPALVRTQLSLAIAALAVHMPGAEWGQGRGVIGWLKSQLTSQPSDIPWLLELVTVIPQEATSDKVAARPERRRQYSGELVQSAPDALDLLALSLSQSQASDILLSQVLEGFAAWLRLSSGIPATTLVSHPLTVTALNGINHPPTFDAAIDAVCELIRYTVSGPNAAGDLAAHLPLVAVLCTHAMSLLPRFEAAKKAAEAERRIGDDPRTETTDEDEDTTKGIARIFAELGEAYVDFIATGTDESMLITKALVVVTSHPDDNIASTTFNFWHRLSNALTGKSTGEMDLGENDALVEAERRRRIALFAPIFQQLVNLVSFRVRYPQGYESWRRDDKSDFKHTRYAVADMLVDVAAVLGGDTTLWHLSQPLFQVAAAAAGGVWEWRTAEASLYCIRAIAKNVPSTEENILPRVLILVTQLPSQPQLLYTASLTIAAYSDWLSESKLALELLPPCLTLLTHALSAPDEVPAAAALAIKHVCDACKGLLSGSISELLQVYQRVMAGAAVAEDAPLHLDSDDELQIVEGISIVVGSLPPDQLSAGIGALCAPVISSLQQLVVAAQTTTPATASPAGQYILQIDRIANIFRYVNQPKAVAAAFQQIWPVLTMVFNQRGSDVRTMERLCRACKYAIRSSGKDLAPSVGSLLQVVEQQFNQHLQPCLLYTTSELLKVFGDDAAYGVALGTLIHALFARTLAQLSCISAFTSNPDLADDCFLLGSRCLRYCPQLVVPTPLLAQLFDCALTGITLQHREACRSLLSFLQEVLELPRVDKSAAELAPHIEAVVMPRGPALTRMLLAALGGALPEPRIDNVVDVLDRMIVLCGTRVAEWGREALRRIPANVMNDSEKQACVQALLLPSGGSSNGHGVSRQPSSLIAAMEEVSDLCRRNKRTLEAVQSALQPQVLVLQG